MKSTAWMAGMMAAFATGMIVSAAAVRARAEPIAAPLWIRPGSCLIVAGGGGTEVVLEMQMPWVRTTSGDPNFVTTEQWRNLAVAQWIQQQPDDKCRARR